MTTQKKTTVRKITVEDLRKMVKEAVVVQKKALLQQKLKENKTIQVTMGQLRTMVKEAVRARLTETSFIPPEDDTSPTLQDELPGVGDLVAWQGKTYFVDDPENEPAPSPGHVAITKDGIRMRWVPASDLQILATGEDMGELSDDEVAAVNTDMGMGANKDPGMDPQEELEWVNKQLENKLLSRESRAALYRRQQELETKLGINSSSMAY